MLMPEIAHSASAERNKAPILQELSLLLAEARTVLEIASGTGQHAEYFAEQMPWLSWQASDPDPTALRSIEARRQRSNLDNLPAALRLDVFGQWPGCLVDAVFTANLLHISPAATLAQLIFGADAVLESGGQLIVYGPFRRAGQFASSGDLHFDRSLRAQNSDWGIRDLETVLDTAAKAGFTNERVSNMPANNLLLMFRKSASIRRQERTLAQ